MGPVRSIFGSCKRNRPAGRSKGFVYVIEEVRGLLDQSVNDLFYLAVPVVASLFLEDVTAWLELHDIRFTPNVKFTGRTEILCPTQ